MHGVCQISAKLPGYSICNVLSRDAIQVSHGQPLSLSSAEELWLSLLCFSGILSSKQKTDLLLPPSSSPLKHSNLTRQMEHLGKEPIEGVCKG